MKDHEAIALLRDWLDGSGYDTLVNDWPEGVSVLARLDRIAARLEANEEKLKTIRLFAFGFGSQAFRLDAIRMQFEDADAEGGGA